MNFEFVLEFLGFRILLFLVLFHYLFVSAGILSMRRKLVMWLNFFQFLDFGDCCCCCYLAFLEELDVLLCIHDNETW